MIHTAVFDVSAEFTGRVLVSSLCCVHHQSLWVKLLARVHPVHTG